MEDIFWRVMSVNRVWNGREARWMQPGEYFPYTTANFANISVLRSNIRFYNLEYGEVATTAEKIMAEQNKFTPRFDQIGKTYLSTSLGGSPNAGTNAAQLIAKLATRRAELRALAQPIQDGVQTVMLTSDTDVQCPCCGERMDLVQMDSGIDELSPDRVYQCRYANCKYISPESVGGV